jgi:2'-5' RNA ligase
MIFLPTNKNMATSAPMIITLEMDTASHDYFTKLRNQYFPRHANYLEAHITLFYHLPSNQPLIIEILKESAKLKPMSLEVTMVSNFGTAVAFVVNSPALSTLHGRLQKAFQPFLISQDRNKLRPHITVQNKVTAFKAKQTHELLNSDFKPFSIQGTGFKTWSYLKGPWKEKEFFPFLK